MNRARIIVVILAALLVSCATTPEGVQPVQDFDVRRYLGKWYEIARLDHRFERGLSNVSAIYTLRDDGGLDVLNRGFDAGTGRWEEATGRAYFVGPRDIARLKVSFFGPFYGGYNVIALDRENYAYALVCGPSRSYLWILAREKRIDRAVLKELMTTAKRLGFATDELIFVKHDHSDLETFTTRYASSRRVNWADRRTPPEQRNQAGIRSKDIPVTVRRS